MKNKFLLPLLVSILIGCTVDDEEQLLPQNAVQELELQSDFEYSMATTTVNAFCGSATGSIGTYGTYEVKHDGFDLYVIINANTGYQLVESKLHIASSEDSFPLVGNGNLPPGKMDYKEAFNQGTTSHTFKISIANELWGPNVTIASKTTFTDGTNTFSGWIGPEKGKSGNWFFLKYAIVTCCELAYAGDGIANEKEISQSFYDSHIRTAFWLRRYLLNNMLDAGVVKSGTFSPTAGYLDQMYNDWAGTGGKDANLPFYVDSEGRLIMSTTYTVGKGSCAEKETIILYIRPTVTSPES